MAPIEGHEMRHRVDFDDAMQVAMGSGKRLLWQHRRSHVVLRRCGERQKLVEFLHRRSDSTGTDTGARERLLWIGRWACLLSAG